MEGNRNERNIVYFLKCVCEFIEKMYVLFIVIKPMLVVDLVYELSHWVNGSTGGSLVEPQCQINFFLIKLNIYKIKFEKS